MTIVTYFLPKNAPLTPEEEEEIDALEGRPVVPDEDCPEISEEIWQKNLYLIQKYKTRRVTKEMWKKEFPELFKNRKVS